MRIGLLGAETGGMVALAPDLRGPVGLQLARAVEQLPGEHGMPRAAEALQHGVVHPSPPPRLPTGAG
ncbi:hypothetical protein GCM10009742_54800 [Kribbella karoonensis]|uniref:Uncharacterized protein n=1 Tax=Kribbella karoonensis TaxID=324851 RepID=A0ABP4Q4L9_9ACTN